MATKPSDTTPEWASNEFYSKGPKIGRLTKSADVSFLVADGHIPGKQFPTSSNEYNKFLSLVSLLTGWVFLGSRFKVDEAVIVETSDNGEINATALNIGGTASGTVAAIFKNNATGDALKLIATEGVALRIDSNNTLTGSPESVIIKNSRTDFAGYVFSIDTDGGPDSLGGMQIDVSTELLLSTSLITSRRLAAINALNKQGSAVEAISSGDHPTIVALNVEEGRTSIRAGFGNEDSVPSNQGGHAIEARGGDGDTDIGFDGGSGIKATGGDAKDGTVDTLGGSAIHAISGLSATEMAGPAVFAQSISGQGHGLFVEHTSSLNSSDLAVFKTGVNAANAIAVDHEGFGDGIHVDAQAGKGVRITMTEEVGNDIGPALNLAPQVEPSTGSNGDLWVPTAASGANPLKFRTAAIDTHVAHTVQPWCAGSDFVSGAVTVTTDTFIDLATVTFSASQQPSAVGSVLLKCWGRIENDATDEALVGLRFTDETANPGVSIKTTLLQMPLTPNVASPPGVAVAFMFKYTLPAAGARTFKLQFNVPSTPTNNASENEAFNWLFEVVAAP